jgi:putative ABC transport system permease protein
MSKLKDFFVFALKGLLNRQLRSWLTMIGIFIGIAAVVSLISLGQGMQQAITAQFAALGTDKFMVMASGGFGPPGMGVLEPVTKQDADLIRQVEGVKLVTQRIIKSARLEFDDEVAYNYITTIPEHKEEADLVQEANNLDIASGRFLKKGDKYKVIVGSDYAETGIFDKAMGLGDKLLIQDASFDIVGIIEKTGSPQTDSSVFIPEEAAKELYDMGDEVSVIVAQVANANNLDKIAENTERMLRKDRGLDEGKENFQVQTPQQILQSLNTVLFIVQAILVGIAAISLIVGGIGIMNTMYTAVIERTRDIGIMKSIGAKNSDVLLLFLIESGMLGTAGGAIGVVIGIMFSEIVAVGSRFALGTSLIDAQFPWYLLVGALAFAFVVGSVSGILPALQASRMQPVEALRYE